MSLGLYEVDTIYCVECSEAMAKLPECCVDLTVTSPPYDRQREYKGFVFDFEPIAQQFYRVTKKGGVVVWIVSNMTENGCESLTSFKQAIYFVECGFRLHDTMIYAKRNYVPLTHNRYEQAFEYMFVLSKGKPRVWNPIMVPTKWRREHKVTHLQDHASTSEKRSAMRTGRYRRPDETWTTKRTKQKSNIWTYGIGKGKGGDDLSFEHPASFPEKLAYDHIVSWSNPGDLVFDPMCGSGTTLKMALQAHRHFLGFDIAQEYVDLSRRRISNVQMNLFSFAGVEVG